MINWLQFDANQPLLFTRPSFWIFFVVVFAVFCLIHKKLKWRSVWLLVASLFFYYKSSGFYFILLILSVLANYGFGRAIAANRNAGKRWLAVAVVFNLAWLVYYKYVYLFAGWFTQLTGVSVSVHDWLGDSLQAIVSGHPQVSDIVLPVGISFFTFQAISYVTDIYRRKIEPLTSIFDFGFYLTFFPQLVAGPIVRAADFVPQINRPFFIYREEFGQGLFFIINGLVKKIIVADYISVNFVDRIFDSPTLYSGFENLLGVYGYAIQIYCDFSGYTDIAIGCARIMGIRLMQNFDRPYTARSIAEFWRRWHISLSSWFKDYLYFPLGGSRCAKWKAYRNLMIVFLVSGLWHGADWTFVIWGVLHGAFQVVGKMTRKGRDSLYDKLHINREGKLYAWGQRIVTFILVDFAWLFFRANNVHDLGVLLKRLFTTWAVAPSAVFGALEISVLTAIIIVFAILIMNQFDHAINHYDVPDGSGALVKRATFVYLLWAIVFSWMILLQGGGASTFIYFQF